MPLRYRPSPIPAGAADRVAIFDPATSLLTASGTTSTELALLVGLTSSILTIDNVKTVSNKTFAQALLPDANNTRDIGSSGTRWKDAYLSGDLAVGDDATISGDLTVTGDLTVNGTTVTLNTSVLDVEDVNVTVNAGGNDASSEGAGLTVDRTGTSGALIYADASATKFRAGAAGSEVDLVGTSSAQALTNKTLVVASNTVTTAASGNLAATELNAALIELQSDIDSRALDSDLSTHIGDTTTHGTTGAVVGTSDSQTLTNKTIVVASNAVTTAASGNLAAVELNAALAELQTDIDTRATTTALNNHINDTTDAHAASAIGNTPSGNLAASDVQAALNELQSDVDGRQPLDAELTALAGLASAADKGIQFTGSGTAATYDLTPAGKALLDDASASVQRTTLGLAIGTDVQAYDPELAALAGLTSAADKVPYFTGSGTAAVTDLTSTARTLLDDTSTSAMRTTLGVAIGSDVQAYDAQLSSLIRQNSQSAAYTTVLTDGGKHIFHPAADNNARTFTINSNANVAYPIGTAITFINEINTVTIAITTDTMKLAGSGTTGSRTLAANGVATAIKTGTTSWWISGTGLT